MTGGITFTFGGVAVDQHAQVINTVDQPIKGLFASGDIVGLFFHNYPSFTGQTRNAVFGRLAGRSAVEENWSAPGATSHVTAADQPSASS